ncbi:MAG: ATP-binding cassette domain-containing protein, partial [Clostridia bacterium]
MENIIETMDLKRAFKISGGDDFFALKGVTITIPKAKLSILRGRSGSGKTTLMNILGSLDEASSGTVIFDNVDLTKLNDDKRGKLRREYVGFVFQSVALIPIM